MKKIILVLTVMFGVFFLTGCMIETGCEAEHWGKVTLINNSGSSGYLNCTYTNEDEYTGKISGNGGSMTFKMDAGTVYLQFSHDGFHFYK